jgi:lysozyme
MALKISAQGLEFIRNWEGVRLEAYQDGAGVWTIGVGSITPPVKPGQKITAAEAMARLDVDLDIAEKAVNDLRIKLMSQHEYDALVSLTFNIGAGALKGSTVARNLQTQQGAHNVGGAMLLWNKLRDPKTGQHVVSKGLLRRRCAEAALYIGGLYLGPDGK